MSNKLSKAKRLKVYNKYNGRCAYCGNVLSNIINNAVLEQTIDHIDSGKPVNNKLENLNPCCRSCNSSKGTKTLEEFRLLLDLKKLSTKFSTHQYNYLKNNYGIDLLSDVNKTKFFFEV